MTVKELIQMLKDEDQDRIIILAKDSEGNNYSPISQYWAGNYIAETTWYGEAYLDQLTEEDIEDGYSEEDVKAGQKALFLIPTY